ncbi:MAG: tandem-95 repeat protein, partial [Candidatus Limnocylindria bacterium]
MSSGVRRGTSRTSLVLIQLLVFVTYIFGPTAAFAVESTAEASPTESAAPEESPDPTADPTAAPTSEPTPAPTEAPDPTEAPAPTQAPATPSPSAPEATIEPERAAPTITSDKEDYAPGELVTLNGANWQPGEQVDIVVEDDQGYTWRRDVVVTADDSGSITDSFNLPSWFVATYRVVATGALSGTATTTFTDGNVKVGSDAGRHFNYTVTLYSTSTNCTTGAGTPATKLADANGTTTGVGGTQSLLIVANLNANAPNGLATFSHWTTPENNQGDSIQFAPGYSATDRTVCVVGFIPSSRDLIGHYNPNAAPVCANDSGSTNEDVTLNDTLLCTDANGNTLTYSRVTNAANGTVTVNANGTFSYVPNANYSGPDSFTFKANDGTVDSNTATYSITVTAVNDAPTCANDAGSTNEDTTLNDTLVCADLDGNTLTYSRVANAAHGTVTVNANGTFSYVPNANYNGPDSFTFKANDGTVDSNTATYSITVNAVNDAPVAVDDADETDEDVALVINPAVLLANDT